MPELVGPDALSPVLDDVTNVDGNRHNVSAFRSGMGWILTTPRSRRHPMEPVARFWFSTFPVLPVLSLDGGAMK